MKNCALKLQTRSKIVLKYALHWLSVQVKLYIRGIWQLLFIAFLLVPIAYFTGKYIEACFQIVALFALRYKFEKTYHASTTMRCTFLTLSIGYLAIPRIQPLSLVLFSSIFIGFLIAFLSWLAQEFIDRKNKITELEKQAQSFSIYTCTKNEFYSYCFEKKVRRDRIAYVWDILRSEDSVIELADKYCVEPETIKQDRWRYKKKLLAIETKSTIDKQ